MEANYFLGEEFLTMNTIPEREYTMLAPAEVLCN
jgi:hypothetical protein